MNVQEQIDDYIAGQPEPKRGEMQDLHRRIRTISPDCRLWFLDGRNDDGKIVSNPNVGYGSQLMKYASGDARKFYQLGLSANTTGLSIYVMGLKDKKYLAETYGHDLGKASITGYCIKFKRLKDIDVGVLERLIGDHLGSRTTS